MGVRTTTVWGTAKAVLWIGCLLLPLTGCQPPQAEMSERLNARMALIDFTGLAPARPVEAVRVTASVPRSWEALPVQTGALFTHCQWRSANHATGVGVVHIRLPLPMSAKTLVWLAKTRYNDGTKPDDGHKVPGGPGRLLREWADPVGREWVEAENDRYRLRGYVLTCGFDAWVVYSGYKVKAVPSPLDIALAGRSMESIVPDALAPAAK